MQQLQATSPENNCREPQCSMGIHGAISGVTDPLRWSCTCSQWSPACWSCCVAVTIPIGSMYGIYANIGGILMVNVTIYSIHGSHGIWSNWIPFWISIACPIWLIHNGMRLHHEIYTQFPPSVRPSGTGFDLTRKSAWSPRQKQPISRYYPKSVLGLRIDQTLPSCTHTDTEIER